MLKEPSRRDFLNSLFVLAAASLATPGYAEDPATDQRQATTDPVSFFLENERTPWRRRDVFLELLKTEDGRAQLNNLARGYRNIIERSANEDSDRDICLKALGIADSQGPVPEEKLNNTAFQMRIAFSRAYFYLADHGLLEESQRIENEPKPEFRNRRAWHDRLGGGLTIGDLRARGESDENIESGRPIPLFRKFEHITEQHLNSPQTLRSFDDEYQVLEEMRALGTLASDLVPLLREYGHMYGYTDAIAKTVNAISK